jgi:hypothetical protein
VGKKNTGAHQGHHCSHCLNHRKSPFAPLHPPNDRAVAQSKRFTGENSDRTRVMIYCNSLFETETGEMRDTPFAPRISTDTQRNHSFTTRGLTPFPPRSGCDIFMT